MKLYHFLLLLALGSLAHAQTVAVFSSDDFKNLEQRLQTIEESAGHPLFARHARSLRALIESEWARRDLTGPGSKLNGTVRADLAAIANGLSLGNDRWEAFGDAGQPLVLAYLSPRDQTLQYYHLVLPRDWKEDQNYPLYVELHGSAGADTRPLGWVEQTLSVAPDYKLRQCSVHTQAMAARDGFHILPYGRGNSGYEDIGEIDIWEALADVERTVKIDGRRRYLYGFSMGGGGTYRLAGEHPELWAAVAIMGGSPGLRDAPDAFATSLAGVPLFLWCGEKDPWAIGSHKKADLLKLAGKAPRNIIFSPNEGHAYTSEVQTQAYTFVSGYTNPTDAPFPKLPREY